MTGQAALSCPSKSSSEAACHEGEHNIMHGLVLVTDNYSFHIKGEVATAVSYSHVLAHYIARVETVNIQLVLPYPKDL